MANIDKVREKLRNTEIFVRHPEGYLFACFLDDEEIDKLLSDSVIKALFEIAERTRDRCDKCGGIGHIETMGAEKVIQSCPTCHGTGRVGEVYLDRICIKAQDQTPPKQVIPDDYDVVKITEYMKAQNDMLQAHWVKVETEEEEGLLRW